MITLEEAVRANDYIRDNADKIAEARAPMLITSNSSTD